MDRHALKQIKYATITLIGGLLMVAGVYFSYANKAAITSVVVGTAIFLYGIHLDLNQKPRNKSPEKYRSRKKQKKVRGKKK